MSLTEVLLPIDHIVAGQGEPQLHELCRGPCLTAMLELQKRRTNLSCVDLRQQRSQSEPKPNPLMGHLRWGLAF